MSEEKEKSFISKLKNQIITVVGVVLTTLGTVFVDEVKSLVGIEVEEEIKQTQTAPTTQATPAIIVNIPELKEKIVVKKVYVKSTPKPTEIEDTDW